MKKIYSLGLPLLLVALITSCKSIPPEFVTSMEKQKAGVEFLQKRHETAIKELAENWYEQRLILLNLVKKNQVTQITLSITPPAGGANIKVIKENELLKIEKQFNSAKEQALKIKDALILGYADSENWEKVLKLSSLNLEMTKSLLELDKAQRSFYAQLVGNNTPFPSDFINDQISKQLKQ